MRKKLPILGMALIFVGVQLIALVLAPLFPTEYQAFEDAENPVNPLIYVVFLLLITGLVLLLIKFGKTRVIQVIFLSAVFITILFVSLPLFFYVIPQPTIDLLLSVITAIAMTALLVIKPEWYVINTVGIIVGAGVAAILGMSLGVLPVMVLLIALAVYDAISVYKTKHMLTLAEGVTKLNLPVLFVVPQERGFSMKSLEGEKITDENREREAIFMGVGDAIIPGVLVVSSLMFLPSSGGLFPSDLVVSLGTLAGGLIGYLVLMRLVLTGRPQAGLPLLNGGAILGYLVSYLLVFQDLTFGLI